jgi:tRNA(Ile)-lysidine synthase
MDSIEPEIAVGSVPPGRWAVGVSGGADSVALLSLLRGRSDVSLHVAHLDHETRGQASTDDAAFVAQLAGEWGLACTVARWRQIEPRLPNRLKNPSARYRAGRRVLFRDVVAANALQGVLLAHHADDQAETVMLRLLSRCGVGGLGGMADRSHSAGLLILRPLLRVRREVLREHLRRHNQSWREDASNASDQYARNRVRRLLASREELTPLLLEVADSCRAYGEWVRGNAPRAAGPELEVSVLRDVPSPLAKEAARRWLVNVNVPQEQLTPDAIERLIEMATDAASPPRQHFPGGVLVRRRGGKLFVDDGTVCGGAR